MRELFMRSQSYRWSFPAAVACFVLLGGADQLLFAAGASSVPKEIQEAFDTQQYAQVLERLGKLGRSRAWLRTFTG
jgi:hypothetical protein